ncbi:unnamed protein product [Lactuca saligna]|nr:unnamed protein product [Lactuca saligna]
MEIIEAMCTSDNTVSTLTFKSSKVCLLSVEQEGSEVKNVPAAESKGFQFDTKDRDRVIPGFLDAIIGIQGGETKSFSHTFPDSWKQQDLRSLPCQCT